MPDPNKAHDLTPEPDVERGRAILVLSDPDLHALRALVGLPHDPSRFRAGHPEVVTRRISDLSMRSMSDLGVSLVNAVRR